VLANDSDCLLRILQRSQRAILHVKRIGRPILQYERSDAPVVKDFCDIVPFFYDGHATIAATRKNDHRGSVRVRLLWQIEG
jgi:hypothetical protein